MVLMDSDRVFYAFVTVCVCVGLISPVATILTVIEKADREERCNTACSPYQFTVVDGQCYCHTMDGTLEPQWEDGQ